MRAAAALCVCAVCLWAGLAQRRQLSRRVRVCAQLRLLLVQLRARVLAGEPVPALLCALAEMRELESLTFLHVCSERVAAGADLPGAWAEAAQTFLTECQAEPEIAAFLPGVGRLITSGSSGQIAATLGVYDAVCARCLDEARRKLARDGKLCVQLGAGAGALLAILIL